MAILRSLVGWVERSVTHQDPYAWRITYVPSCGLRSPSKLKGKRCIWQRRYREHTLRDETDWQRHISYIYYNPVKHQLVKQVADWEHSKFHRYVDSGIYPRNWGGNNVTGEGQFGEV